MEEAIQPNQGSCVGNNPENGNKIKAALWGIKLAWKIDKKMLITWGSLSFILALLPAVSLHFNREIIAKLSLFLTDGSGVFSDLIPAIIILGLILTISGLSARLNDDLLYMMMFDSFYLGLEEVMMDAGYKIELNELLKKEKTDEYYAVISRCGSLTDLASSGCALATKLISIGSIMAVAFAASPAVSLAALFYVITVIALNISLSGKIRIVFSEWREHMRRSEYFEKLSQDGDTAKETRIFESAEKIKDHWRESYGNVEAMELRQTRGYAKLNFFTNIGFYIFMAAVMLYSVYNVSLGRMAPDLLLMLFTMCTAIALNISTIARSYQRLDYGLYGLDIQKRFFEGTPHIDEEREAAKRNAPLDADIVFEAKDLCFSYRADTPVLRNVNFRIHQGETIALVGANGSGKTTLIKVLLGLCHPTSGQALFMGGSHWDYRMDFYSAQIGSFFQDFYLFHISLAENVGIGSMKNVGDREMIIAAMDKGGASKLIDKLPEGLDSIIGRQVYKNGSILSGGENQRIAVSRAHMSDKKVMVFDEPASMLDPIAEMEQFHNIKERLQGRTALLVSHRIGFARLADRIIVLKDGELAENGTHQDLLNAGGEYARFFREQSQWYDTETGS
ncbi:ABC transporter ATP-binding protein/permease [Treponema sp. OttesenSCG-928-L16]|nr:ABC transporter ATP-binding protein/permease [Treponema sp. OttesenSCG-928-L16]